MTRSTETAPAIRAEVQDSPTLNLLLVAARPSGRQDVGYRTISRPLVERLRQVKLPVKVDIVRPGSYEALERHLRVTRDRYGKGYYHVIHFDVHGALLRYEEFEQGCQTNGYTFQQRYGRPDIAPYEGQKAFLAFEGEASGQPDLAEAAEIADLLRTHHIPIAVLNACQSGKQAGERETCLANYLLNAGLRTVLAMSYSVTVSAATLLIEELYRQLFERGDLAAAICRARCALFNHKERRAYFDQRIDLEDWLLPVVYQHGGGAPEPAFALRRWYPEEEAAYFTQQAGRYRAPQPEYGFVGRDVDILQIEKRLLSHSEGQQRNLLLLRGMGGAGKSTLLRHLAEWWQTTHFVERVFYFGYDEKAYTLPQIMDLIAQQLFEGGSLLAFRDMGPAAQQQKLARELRSARHLLILDNLKSVTGEQLAIQHTLPPQEREQLRGFLHEMLDGQPLVLLGSRGKTDWLIPSPLRETDIYDLPGLDPEAASTLAERILQRHVNDRKTRESYQASAEFRQLLKLLDGYPLPLEVVFANLKRQSPAQILAALQAGDVNLDNPDAQDKTASILKCIDYSHSNLSPRAQSLLLCLAPFTGVIWADMFNNYIQHLQQQPRLEDSFSPPCWGGAGGGVFDNWQEVLQEAINWGLLSPHAVPGYLHVQPTLPYFLRARLAGDQSPGSKPKQAEARSPNEQDASASFSFETGDLSPGIESAFRQHYDDLGDALEDLLDSKDPQERQLGQLLTGLEYENLHTALGIALREQASIWNTYVVLDKYLEGVLQDQNRALALARRVREGLERYAPERLAAEPLCWDLDRVLNDSARHQLMLKHLPQAEQAYQDALQHLEGLQGVDATRQAKSKAGTYHQLGCVAQEQRQWARAEQAYQQALAIKIEFNDRYRQASTYGQLGSMAQEQRQWARAEQAYQQALALFIEFNDRYSQAGTYHQLGSVAHEQQQFKQAEEYCQQALQIYISYEDKHGQARVYNQLALIAEDQKQWPQARDYFLKALQIFVEFQDEHNLGIVLRSLARLYHASGDAGLPAAAAKILGRSPAELTEAFQHAGD